MTALVPLPIILPLLAAGFAIVGGRYLWFQRAISIATLSALTVISVLLAIRADDDGFVVHQAGGWPAPLGITLVVDRLAALMLVVSSGMLLAVMIYAIGQPRQERRSVAFHPVYLVLATGVSASFITGDLFNLFVAFEMMLVASYVLLTLGGQPDQVRSGMSYVVISLVASALFITLLALLYAATGTVNMAQLSERVGELDSGVRVAFSIAALIVFGIKAGLFPLFFWLPDAYPTAPGPITAIFAGLLTKVGVYAIIRTQTLVFGAEDWMGTVLLIVAALTMAVGVFGAIAQNDMKRILAFHIISQIGYMILGLGLFTVAGLAGAIFYVIHHIVVKTTLFLVAGLVDVRAGTCRLSEVGGLIRTAPLLAALFVFPALSLAGMPPFSGFVAKFALADAGLTSREWIVVGVSLAVGLFTLFSMTKIWAGVFWSEAEEEPKRAPITFGRLGGPPAMVLSTGALVIASLVIAFMAGPLYDISERAGADLMSPSTYIEAVLGADR